MVIDATTTRKGDDVNNATLSEKVAAKLAVHHTGANGGRVNVFGAKRIEGAQFGLHVIKFPSGKFGYAGSIPENLHEATKTRFSSALDAWVYAAEIGWMLD